MTPSTPTPCPAHIDLNSRPVADVSSSGGTRKHAWEMSADMFSDARNLFDGMPVAINNERANHFIQSIIFEGALAVANGSGYDLDETQSQDGCGGPFTPLTYDQARMQLAFVQDQVGLDLDGFPPDHVFPDDYSLEEEDEADIDGEPLFEDELVTQATEVQPK
ncbi:DNA repair protein rhp54 [Hordeum vulgare]|nr:DNA repair protein rhp54 [Hordeum vulgare]